MLPNWPPQAQSPLRPTWILSATTGHHPSRNPRIQCPNCSRECLPGRSPWPPSKVINCCFHHRNISNFLCSILVGDCEHKSGSQNSILQALFVYVVFGCNSGSITRSWTILIFFFNLIIYYYYYWIDVGGGATTGSITRSWTILIFFKFN